MNKIILFLTLSFLYSPLTYATDVEIIDGDTIRFNLISETPDEKVRGRLIKIDAPEMDQPYGVAAREHLQILIEEYSATPVFVGCGFYGRVLIDFNVPDILERMVSDGYAWTLDETYAELEEIARKERVGLWIDLNTNFPPIHPRDWRKMRKAEKMKYMTDRIENQTFEK